MNELAAGKAPAPPTTTSSPSPHTSPRTPLAEGTALVGGGARPPRRWPEVLVVMPSLVESVKVAPRSGMVVLVLRSGNAISFNPDVVRRLSKAALDRSSSSEPEPSPGVSRTSGWARLMERLGL